MRGFSVDAPLNIYCTPKPGQARHDQSDACWCQPHIFECDIGPVIVHTGHVYPSVTALLKKKLWIEAMSDQARTAALTESGQT